MKNILFVKFHHLHLSLKINSYGDNKTDLTLDNIDNPDFESRDLKAAALAFAAKLAFGRLLNGRCK